MSTNKLKLNPETPEFRLIGNEKVQSKFLSMFSVQLFGVKTNPAKSVRNLGVIFKIKFTFHSQVSTMCSSRFYHMQDLWYIRHNLDMDSAKLLATALASSRLHYDSSFLYAISNTDLTNFKMFGIDWSML